MLVRGSVIAHLLLRPSIRMKFLLGLVVIAMIPFIVLSWLNDRAMRAAVTSDAERSLLATAQQISINIDRFVTERIDSIRTLAQLPEIEGSFRSNPGAGANQYQQAGNILQSLARENSIYLHKYQLLDTNGVVVADSSNTELGRQHASASYFQTPMRTGLPYVSAVEFPADMATDSPEIHFSSPVRDANRAIAGVLVVHYRAVVLQKMINESGASSKTQMFSVLFDENLLRIADSAPSQQLYTTVVPLDEARLAQLQAEHRLPPVASASLATNGPALAEVLRRDAKASTFTLDTYQGAVQKLNQRPWQIVTFQPQEVTLLPVRDQRRSALLFGLAIIVGVIAIALLVSSLFSTPILHLTQMMQRVTAGDLTVQSTLRSSDEIGQLAQGFNSMTQQLRQTQEGLEQRVAQRTVELADALAAQAAQAHTLREALATQQQLTDLVRQLSVPVIPVREDTLVIPLIGTFDAERGQQMSTHVLHQIEVYRARIIILDATGMPLIDTQVAQILIELTNAARLLGARAILVGIRPEIAQTLVSLGVYLDMFQVMPTLQQALTELWHQ